MTATRYYRKVIKIRAEDSPNVRYALAQQAQGIAPTNEIVLPGVLAWDEYQKRRETWDSIRQCIGLDAEFYEGAELLLYPPEWLNRAERIAAELPQRKAQTIGVDPAEGGDSTAMAAVDEQGLIELVSKKTPNTAVITGEVLAFMQRHQVAAENVLFDRGGGGKQHADRLRQQGYPVRTVAFGESLVPEIRRGLSPVAQRKEQREEHYAYKNRRAQMYGLLSERLDPTNSGFGLPAKYGELRRQLAPIPRQYDSEGRLTLPPKSKRDKNDKRQTLTDLIGCSPDEADALVLAVYGLEGAKRFSRVGVAF